MSRPSTLLGTASLSNGGGGRLRSWALGYLAFALLALPGLLLLTGARWGKGRR